METDKSIKFGYFQVFTNSGIGYVCVALKRPAKDSTDRKYRASFAFCSPKDNSKFVKARARNIATLRLNANKLCVEGEYDQTTKLSDIFADLLEMATEEHKLPEEKIQQILENSEDEKELSKVDLTVAPSWVKRAWDRGDIKFGLTQYPPFESNVGLKTLRSLTKNLNNKTIV